VFFVLFETNDSRANNNKNVEKEDAPRYVNENSCDEPLCLNYRSLSYVRKFDYPVQKSRDFVLRRRYRRRTVRVFHGSARFQ